MPWQFQEKPKQCFSCRTSNQTKKEQNRAAWKETVCMQEMIEAARKKAQSQQVPERSESSIKDIVSEAELEQAKREITDLKEKIGY